MQAQRSIAATSRSGGNLDLFTVGADGVVYTTWWHAGSDWGAVIGDWRPIGGYFPPGAPITAIARTPDNIDLFVVGNDGVVYTSWWSSGSEWSGIHNNWRPIGGLFPRGARVSATSRSPGNLDLFITGNDGVVYTEWWYQGSDWSGIHNNWRPIGGSFPVGAPVTAITKSPNSIDLFIIGNDGVVYTEWWNQGSDWSGIHNNWRPIGGLFPRGAQVSATSRGPGNLDLFITGNDGVVHTEWWYQGSDWSGIHNNWRPIGGTFPVGAPVTAITKSPNSIDLFITGNDGVVYTEWWNQGSDWSGIHNNWRAIGGFFPAGIPITATARTPSNLDLFIVGNDHRVWTSWWSGGADWSGIHNNWRVLAPDEKTFTGNVETPAGTALGGNVGITVRRNGSWTATFHMHDSGAVGYDFEVTATLVARNGLTLLARHGGHVGGTLTSGSREDLYTEQGFNALIGGEWDSIVNGRLWVTKDYSATGVAGVVEDVAKAVLDVGAGAAGGALGVVIALTSEAGQLLGNLGLGGTFGVISGVVVFAFGGSVVLAVAGGVAAGAMTNALIKQRPLTPDEVRFANNNVFGGTLPGDRITLTNLAGLGGRAFTMPGVDGRIYVNLGSDAYNVGPMTYTNNSYPSKGELLIHELTHAWQIAHSSFLPGLVCEGVVIQANNQVGESVYQYPAPGGVWSSFNLEQQGAIVDQWFGGVRTAVVPQRSAMNPADPYFPYIRDNIRTGRG